MPARRLGHHDPSTYPENARLTIRVLRDKNGPVPRRAGKLIVHVCLEEYLREVPATRFR